MTDPDATADAGLIADLNDLLRLDRDAERAYAEAIASLKDERHRVALYRCCRDHGRHVAQLARTIRRRGGVPVDPGRLAPGPFTWGVRAVAGLGGDREILSAIRANEAHLLERYGRAARSALPADVAALLRLHTREEAEHHDRVEEMLEERAAGQGDEGWTEADPAGPAFGSGALSVD